MGSEPWQDEEFLRELYVEKRLKQEEIAEKLDCHQGTISNWLNKFDIERPWRNKAVLEEMYVEKGMSTYEIGNELRCNSVTIGSWLNKYDIETRKNSREKVPHHCFSGGYEVIRHTDGEKNRKLYIHRLVAVAEYGFDAVKDMHIHHENGFKFDNRHCNLTPMTESDHHSLHQNPEAGDIIDD